MAALVAALVVALVFLGLGVYSLHLARLERRHLAALKHKRGSGKGAQIVDLTGVVEPAGAFPAPITGKTCVQCSWFLEQRAGGPGEELSGQLGAELALRAEGARARLELGSATIEHSPASHDTGEVTADSPFRPAIAALASGHGVEPERIVRWTELRIVPGDPVVAIGPVLWDEEEPGGGRLLVLGATPTEELLVSNTTGSALASSLSLTRRTALGLGLGSLALALAAIVVGLLLSL